MFLGGKLQGEDEVEIIVGDVAGVAGKHCTGARTVESEISRTIVIQTTIEVLCGEKKLSTI